MNKEPIELKIITVLGSKFILNYKTLQFKLNQERIRMARNNMI